MTLALPSQSIAVLQSDGRMSLEWYRYFEDLHNAAGFGGGRHPLYQPLSISPLSMTPDPGAAPGLDDIDGSSLVRTYFFDAASVEALHFSAQLPFGYDEETDITPAVLWAPSTTGTGNVVWRLQYNWLNIDGSTGTTASSLTITSAATATAFDTVLAEATSDIDGDGKKRGSVIIGRISRLATDAEDTYAADAALLALGFVYHNQLVGTVRPWPTI